MGNFGKRILIVFIVVLTLVCLVLVGNAIQQSEKIHKVNNSKEVVYALNDDIKITRGDLWHTIVNGGSIATIVEMLDGKLLESVANDLSAEKIAKKRLMLKYGVANDEELAKLDEQTKTELEETYANRLAVLNITDEEYVKTMAAYDEYARSLLENAEDGKVTIGSKTIDLSEQALKEEWLKGYNDTEALIIRFYSEKDATDYMDKYNANTKYVLISDNSANEIRYYVGDSMYTPERDVYDEYKVVLNETGDLVTVDEEVEVTEGRFEKVPFAYILKNDSGYIWDSEYEAFVSGQDEETGKATTTTTLLIPTKADEKYYIIEPYTGTGECKWQARLVKKSVSDGADGFVWEAVADGEVIVDNKYKTYEEAKESDSMSLYNTAALSSEQIFDYYVDLYNTYYAKQGRTQIMTTVNEADVIALVSNLDEFKAYGYVVQDGHIYHYVGNEEYIVDFENSVNGELVYKTYGSNNRYVPNYLISRDADGNPIFGNNNDFVYILDENGEYQFLGVSIDEATSFEVGVNCIESSRQELFSLYKLLSVEENSELRIVYDELVQSMPALATQIFVNNTGSYFLNGPTELKETSKNSNDEEVTTSDYWYMVYKLTPTDRNATKWNDALYQELKAKAIEDYVANTSLVNMALASLRKEAGLKIYDKFYSIDYVQTLLSSTDESNTYGLSSESTAKEWFEAASYKNNKVAELTKEVTLKANGKEYTTLKYKIDGGAIVDYCLVHSPATYISRAVLEKKLLTMDEFEVIHGVPYNKVDYLTSKNWKQVEYREATENVANNYNYYSQMYAYYGLQFNYDSAEDFLYSYGSRTYDELVLNLEKNTMRNVFLANHFLGSYNVNLNETFTPNANFTELMNDIESITTNYFDAIINHILVYVDFNLDGTVDNFYDSATGKYNVTKETGKPGIDNEKWNVLLDGLYDRMVEFIERDDSLTDDNADVLDELITEFNNASREVDNNGDYVDVFGEAKEYGICLKHESLGEINTNTIQNYVKGFIKGLTETKAHYDASDKDLRPYGLSTDFYDSDYGTHLIILRKATNYETKFNYSNEDGSLDGYTTAAIVNDNDTVTAAQIALYIQVQLCNNIFGSTDLPREKAKQAGFENYYPAITAELSNKITAVYGTYLKLVLDLSNTYDSSYLILKEMATNPGEFGACINAMAKTYENAVYAGFRDGE
ncbi:hypothetical protein IKQ02_00545 [bacterium]|nr:hypothetical protein [bacterium]